MKHFGIFFFIILFHISFNTKGQTTTPFTENIDIAVKHEANFPNEGYNKVISTIATYNKKNKTAISFTFPITLRTTFTALPKKQTRVITYISFDNIKGDSKLKDFDLTSFLQPSIANMQLTIWGKKSEVIKQFYFKGSVNSSFTILDTIISINQPISQLKPSFKIQSIELNKQQSTYAEQQILMIGKYYESSTRIPEAIETLKSFDLTQTDMIVIYDCKLDAIESYFNDLTARNIDKKLSIKAADLLNFKKNCQQLELQINYYRKNINIIHAQLDKALFDRGMELYRLGNIEKAIELMTESVESNTFQYDAQYYLSAIKWELHKDSSAYKNIIDLYKIQLPPASKHKRFMNLLNSVCSYYINKGNQLILEENFNEAIIQFNNADSLYNAFPTQLNCKDALFQGMRQAKYGMYNSYLRVIKKAIDQRLWNMAETYIVQARKYQAENNNVIPSDFEVKELLEKIYEKFIVNGQKLHKEAKYEESLKYYQKALDYCSKYGISANIRLTESISQSKEKIYFSYIQKAQRFASDSLIDDATSMLEKAHNYRAANNEIANIQIDDSTNSRLNRSFYGQYIVKGKQEFNNNRHHQALQWFKKAVDIEKQSLVARDSLLPAMISKSAENVILKEITKISYYLWANKIDSANILHNKLSAYQYTYGLDTISIINNSITESRKEIDLKICSNLKADFDKNIKLADENISKNNFITARDYLRKSISLCRTKNICAPDSAIVVKKINQIDKPLQYELLRNDASDAFNNSDFEKFVTCYLKAYDIYKNNELQKLQILDPPISSYIIKANKIDITKKCLEILCAKQSYEQALLLANAWKQVAAKASDYKMMIRTIAKSKANSDYKLNPRNKAKDNLKELETKGLVNGKFRRSYWRYLFLMKNGMGRY